MGNPQPSSKIGKNNLIIDRPYLFPRAFARWMGAEY
jgi:hypothetical protein